MSSREVVAGAVGAGVIGVLVGAMMALWWSTTEVEVVERVVTETEQIVEAVSDEKLEAMCATLTRTDRERLQGAQDDVVALRSSLDAKELELAELKLEQSRRADAGAELAAKVRALEAELKTVREELVTVTQERDVLLVDLRDTVLKLDAQIRETEKYKAAAKKRKRRSTENLWRSFSAEVKVEICDRGTVKKHDKCHDAVRETLTPALQDRFEHCVDSEQATPTLSPIDKGDTLPSFAEMLPDDKRFPRKGWYIQFCDPTLPEAGAY